MINQINHSLKNRGFTKHYGNYDFQIKAQNFNKKKKKEAKGTWHQQHKTKTLEDWLE